MRAVLSSLIVGCVFALGCAGVDDDDGSLGKSSAAISTGAHDNGTELTATTAAGEVACSGGSGTVALTGSVSTTGSVDSVVITASVDGGGATTVATLQPQDFVHSGRTKTADYAFSLTLENGTHSVEVCFVQSGSNGRLPKTTCLAAVSVTVDCHKKAACNQGVGNGSEGCDPGNSNNNQPSNDENGGTPGSPGRGK